MNSTEIKVVADYLIGNFEYEMQTTLRVLAAVPAVSNRASSEASVSGVAG